MEDLSKRQQGRSYTIEAVARACQVLQAFSSPDEILRLRDLVQRSGANRTTVFRIVRTLMEADFVESVGPDRYRSRIKRARSNRFRIAYATQTGTNPFAKAVTEGLRAAASEESVDLLEFDNKFSATIAVRNAELMIKAEADVAIEYQVHEQVAPVISALFHDAGIPLIAISVPHPGAVYFGANGYEAGRMAGVALGRWARANWKGCFDFVLLLELPWAGALPHTRLTGVVSGICEVLGDVPESRIQHLDGQGQFGPSIEAMRRFIRQAMRQRELRCLITGVNDSCVLGSLRAFEEVGRAGYCAAVGLGGSIEARWELRKSESRLIGSVALFPESYGEKLISLAESLRNGRPVPPAVFHKQRLMTAENVDQLYPNDVLLPGAEPDLLLLRAP